MKLEAAELWSWWPDWSRHVAVIVATGPSARSSEVGYLRDDPRAKVFAIKEAAVDLCPWAHAAYGCDWPWWVYRKGLPLFGGLKFAWDKKVHDRYADVFSVDLDAEYDQLLLDEPLKIGCGGNSGFQALNLALQFGARQVILVGFDLHGYHYYGRNSWNKANNPDETGFKRWTRAFEGTIPSLKSIGAEVLNASRSSRLECYKKVDLREAVEEICGSW